MGRCVIGTGSSVGSHRRSRSLSHRQTATLRHLTTTAAPFRSPGGRGCGGGGAFPSPARDRTAGLLDAGAAGVQAVASLVGREADKQVAQEVLLLGAKCF